MKRQTLAHPYGFSLVELMVYAAISSLFLGTMYQTFYTQQQSYILHTHIAEMQQNLRSGIQLMTKDLRSAGYNPDRLPNVGFVTSFPAPNNTFTINYATSKDIIAFTTNTEQIAYRHNAARKTLERFNATNGGWDAVVDNVDAVNFVYLKSDGTRATQASDIRSVEIALLVRSRIPDPKFTNTAVYRNKRGETLCPECSGDHYHRRLLTTTVQARNLR